MKALSPTKTFAQLAQATNRIGTKAKNNCDMRPSADAMLVLKSAQSLLLIMEMICCLFILRFIYSHCS